MGWHPQQIAQNILEISVSFLTLMPVSASKSKVKFLADTITSESAAILFQKRLAWGVLAIGVGIIALSIPLGSLLHPEATKALMPIGGVFFSSLSGFPFKDILARRVRVVALTYLKNEYRELEKQPDETRQQELNKEFEQLIYMVLGLPGTV